MMGPVKRGWEGACTNGGPVPMGGHLLMGEGTIDMLHWHAPLACSTGMLHWQAPLACSSDKLQWQVSVKIFSDNLQWIYRDLQLKLFGKRKGNSRSTLLYFSQGIKPYPKSKKRIKWKTSFKVHNKLHKINNWSEQSECTMRHRTQWPLLTPLFLSLSSPMVLNFFKQTYIDPKRWKMLQQKLRGWKFWEHIFVGCIKWTEYVRYEKARTQLHLCFIK